MMQLQPGCGDVPGAGRGARRLPSERCWQLPQLPFAKWCQVLEGKLALT